jgi:hypothetical protein
VYLTQLWFDDGVQGIGRQERPSVVGLYTNMMTKRNILEMARAAESGINIVLGGRSRPTAEHYCVPRGHHRQRRRRTHLEALLPHSPNMG